MPNMIISTYRDSKEIIHAYKSVSSYKSAAKRFCVYLPLFCSSPWITVSHCEPVIIQSKETFI